MAEWERVRLGEVLLEQKRRVGSLDADGMPLLGVSNQRGLHRSGMPRISDMSRYLHVERDWFAYNPMRINVGSLGLSECDDQTGVISPDYVVFSCGDRILPQWVFYYLRHPLGLEAINAATAGSVRERLYFHKLAEIKIPLPPLLEQRRLVARIEALAAEIDEAKRLRREAAEEAGELPARALSRFIDDEKWPRCSLIDVLAENPRNGLGPQPEVESGGRPMLRINAVSSTTTKFVDMSASKRVEAPDERASHFELRDADVFIVRYNGDINRVAKPAIYKGENSERAIYPDKLIRLRADPGRIDPEFLVATLNSRTVRTQIEDLGRTTAGNIGVSGGDAKAFQIPLPPLPEQRRIVAELDALQAQVDALKRLQSETAAELDALLPAILDRAFKGEL